MNEYIRVCPNCGREIKYKNNLTVLERKWNIIKEN